MKSSYDEMQGRVLHAARVLAGLSLSELSRLTLVSEEHLSAVELGRINPFTVRHVKQVLQGKGIMIGFDVPNGLVNVACSFSTAPDAAYSVVRENLLTVKDYRPYCGRSRCFNRASFDGDQFTCTCGWKSSFPPEFILEYKAAVVRMEMEGQ